MKILSILALVVSFAWGYSVEMAHGAVKLRMPQEQLQRSNQDFQQMRVAFERERDSLKTEIDNFNAGSNAFDKMVDANARNERNLRSCISGWNGTIESLNKSTATIRDYLK